MNYTITFHGTNDIDPRALGTSSVTVINSEIQTILVIDESKTVTETIDETIEVVEVEPVVEEPVVKEPEVIKPPVKTPPVVSPTPKPVPQAPVYEQEFVYTIPVSDPNGRTDISTKFISLGTIIGNTFFKGEVKQNSTGAIQFEVKNLGTKTSSDWIFKVKMPNETTFTSTKQSPLKPNERALITIGFNSDSDSTHTFVVTIDESTDTYSLNDRFSQTVTFAK